MVDDPKSLTPEQLHHILTSLDRVMEDAEHLRQTITRQLSVARANDQPRVSPVPERGRRPGPDSD